MKAGEYVPSKMECDVFKVFINDLEETLAEAPNRLDEIREHRNPFQRMKIADNDFLKDIDGRSPCPKCSKSRKFFCYTCYVPTKGIGPLLPVVKVSVVSLLLEHFGGGRYDMTAYNTSVDKLQPFVAERKMNVFRYSLQYVPFYLIAASAQD